MDRPELEPSQLRFTPYSTCYSSFFLLRTSVTICGQQAVINYSTSGELTLHCRNPSLSVPFRTISAKVDDILKKYGVSHVGNFFCEDVPLYQVSFPSEYKLEKFVRVRPRVQSELASLFSEVFTEVQAAASPIVPSQPVPTAVQTNLFLVSPDALRKDAQIDSVTLENCSTCMTLWKESELFDFGSLFRVYRLDPRKLPGGGAVTLKALVTELEDVLDWFNFGVHLEVRESDLMIIRHTHLNSRDVKASKTDLFTTWIRTSSLLTWSAVVRALVGIRMEPLAKKLAMKYGVAVPPSRDLPSPWQRYTSDQIDPTLRKELQSDIQGASVELETKKLRLNQTTNSLEQEKKATAIARSEIQFAKRSLSPGRSKLVDLHQKQRQKIQELEIKKRELYFLQLQLKEQQKGNKELNAIIQIKEEEISQLHDSVSKLDAEILSAKEEIKGLGRKLQIATRELEMKSSRVQELERERGKLESTLDWERRSMELLMQSAASASMKSCSVEAQLSIAKDQSRTTVDEGESETHRQAVAEKDKEIGKLSEQVQALEFQLQEVMEQQTGDEAMEEEQVVGMVEISDLRVQLAEAKGEKEEMNGKLEAVLEEQRKIKNWIDSLEKCRSTASSMPVTSGSKFLQGDGKALAIPSHQTGYAIYNVPRPSYDTSLPPSCQKRGSYSSCSYPMPHRHSLYPDSGNPASPQSFGNSPHFLEGPPVRLDTHPSIRRKQRYEVVRSPAQRVPSNLSAHYEGDFSNASVDSSFDEGVMFGKKHSRSVTAPDNDINHGYCGDGSIAGTMDLDSTCEFGVTKRSYLEAPARNKEMVQLPGRSQSRATSRNEYETMVHPNAGMYDTQGYVYMRPAKMRAQAALHQSNPIPFQRSHSGSDVPQQQRHNPSSTEVSVSPWKSSLPTISEKQQSARKDERPPDYLNFPLPQEMQKALPVFYQPTYENVSLANEGRRSSQERGKYENVKLKGEQIRTNTKCLQKIASPRRQRSTKEDVVLRPNGAGPTTISGQEHSPPKNSMPYPYAEIHHAGSNATVKDTHYSSIDFHSAAATLGD